MTTADQPPDASTGSPPPVQPYVGRETPALARLRETAEALGPLAERVVFIGGAVAPLLQIDPVLPRIRATRDIDGIIASASYVEHERVREELRERGFSEAALVEARTDGRHVHKWTTPTGGEFDLVPAGDHPGGTGSRWDSYALESGERLDVARKHGQSTGVMLPPQLVIRHASAVAFLALKWAAYHDRGQDDPRLSHDLEDIVAVVVSRPTIRQECAAAPVDVRSFIAAHTRTLLGDAEVDELLDGHLGLLGSEAVLTRRIARERLHGIAGLAHS